MKVNERILAVRKEMGLSQVEFGKRVGISGPAVAKLESGKNNASEAVVRMICSAFNVSYLWLTDGIGEMHEPVDTDDEMIDKIMIHSSDFARQVMKDFARVADDKDWELLSEIMQKWIGKIQKADQ